MNWDEEEFKDLKGKTLVSVVNDSNSELIFKTDDGEIYILYHYQDCCESVFIEEIHGDLNDLIGSKIVMAEEYSSFDKIEGMEDCDSFTFTFYRLATNKGFVTIRWFGESNGYYSESVDFERIEGSKVKDYERKIHELSQ